MLIAVYRGPRRVLLEDREKPAVRQAEDVIVQVTLTTVCGTDLHPYRGHQEKPAGFFIGHECVGLVDEVGPGVRNFRPGDRVIVPSTICCGACRYCTAGLTAQCEATEAGTLRGAQAEHVRVPYAPANLLRIPASVPDEAAIALCDIFPTGYFGAELARVQAGDSVAVFGAGPVGLMAMCSAALLGAVRIFAIDNSSDRLEAAAREGFIPVDFAGEEPVKALRQLTRGGGVAASIECVGEAAIDRQGRYCPEQALVWAAEATEPGGSIGLVGDFTHDRTPAPLEALMHKNLAIRSGIAPHRSRLPTLLEYVRIGRVDPTFVLDATFDLHEIEEVYRQFERRGLIKAAIRTPAGRERAARREAAARRRRG